MNIDNINLIKPLLKRESENDFYFIQIIARKKDIEWFTGNNRVIKDYYIHSLEQLEKRYDEIKKLCNEFNARAYIRLSRRNTEDIARDIIVLIWDAFRNNSYNHLRKIYSTACWQSLWLDKFWIIDIDWPQDWFEIKSIIDNTYNLNPIWDKKITIIPTKNWMHIITKPFDLQKFKMWFPNIDVHKNNPTILYM